MAIISFENNNITHNNYFAENCSVINYNAFKVNFLAFTKCMFTNNRGYCVYSKMKYPSIFFSGACVCIVAEFCKTVFCVSFADTNFIYNTVNYENDIYGGIVYIQNVEIQSDSQNLFSNNKIIAGLPPISQEKKIYMLLLEQRSPKTSQTVPFNIM